MSRIIALKSENVKRLHAVTIEPDENLFVIGGKNGSGKSSVLDSIFYCLAGKSVIPNKPVRDGQKKAKIEIKLDDGTVISRTITENGGGTLTVTAADGETWDSPQTGLNKLYSACTFDPVRFISLDEKPQLEELRKIVKLDFSALDTERKTIFEQRTDLKKEVERLRAKIQLAAHHKDVVDEKERSAAEILKELAAAQEKNLGKKRLEDAFAAAERNYVREAANLARIDGEIKELEERLAALRERQKSAEKIASDANASVGAAKIALESFVETPIAEIQTKLSEVEDYNRKVRDNLAWNLIVKEGREKSAKVDSITARIDAIDQEKKEMLASADFPVPGLSFDENGVLFNGLPFNQASSAQQLRVSVAIAAAAKPELRVMLVREGSLLDEDALAELGKLAEEFNLQVWVERVSQGGECSVIIENGWVKGEEGEDETEKKPVKKTAPKVDEEDLPF